jgi:hypothetical protein
MPRTMTKAAIDYLKAFVAIDCVCYCFPRCQRARDPARLLSIWSSHLFLSHSPIDSILGCGDRRRSGLLVAHYYRALNRRGPFPNAALDALDHGVFDVPIFHHGSAHTSCCSALLSTALIATLASLIRCRTPTFHATAIAIAAVD